MSIMYYTLYENTSRIQRRTEFQIATFVDSKRYIRKVEIIFESNNKIYNLITITNYEGILIT